jgi:type IV pilus assembly protein PilQ
LLLCAAAAALLTVSGSATAPAAPTVRLTSVTTRVHPGGAALVVEATEPVPYVSTRPDPLTLVLDFRNVSLDGFANTFAPQVGHPVAGVAVQSDNSLGAPVARLRITLSEPANYRVRSERSAVIVDFDPASAQSAVARTGAGPAPAAVTALTADPIEALNLGRAAVDGVRTAGVPAASAALAPQTPAPPAAPVAPTPTPPAAQPPTPAPQTPSGPAAAEQTFARTQRTYNGHPVSLDFQGADLRAVLRTFSEISGLNIVIDPAVQGSVDVMLTDVPWDQALDLILRANKLGYIVDNTIVRIAPLTVLAEEEAQRRKLAEEQALAGDLRVLTKTLSYAKAEELQPLLTRSALSQRGTVQIDARTNTLIITDLEDRLATATELINTLDRAQPQVEIEARIVQTSKTYARQLGVQWGFSGRVDPALGNTTNLAFPNNGSLSGRTGAAQGPNGQPTAVNLGVGAATSAVGLALGSVNGAFNLDVALSALESSGNGRILSTPRVSTLNNVEAEVTQGVQIPLQVIANNTVTVSFKDAALTLKVTPQITAADTVIMKVTLENATPDFARAAGPAAIPPIDTQRAITTLLVSDGQTTVIGGIYTSNQQNSNDRTPGLSQIPLLSWLFKRDRISDESRELLIFITPRIIRG